MVGGVSGGDISEVIDSWVGKICWRRDRLPTPVLLDFLCGSAGKESACNAGDLGSIPGSERSPGEGKGYPLQYSGLENAIIVDFPIAQMVKNLPAMQEMGVWSLGQEDTLEKEMAIHSSILDWRIPWTEAWQAIVHGVRKSWIRLSD